MNLLICRLFSKSFLNDIKNILYVKSEKKKKIGEFGLNYHRHISLAYFKSFFLKNTTVKKFLSRGGYFPTRRAGILPNTYKNYVLSYYYYYK